MRAPLAAMNLARGMIAVEVEGYGYTVAEVLDAIDFERGDVISGDFDSMGSQTWRHERTGRSFRVFVENKWVSREQLRTQLLFDS